MYSDEFIEKMTAQGAIIGYAADFYFPSETIHNHTGVGNVVINGTTYFGVGEFGSISGIDNVADANPASVELGLVGIPSQVFNLIMQSNIRGSDVTVYKVVYSSDGKVLIAEPIIVGQVTNYTWSFSDTGSFSLEVADEFNLYERPLQKFYTQASWLADKPDDNFWKYVAQLSTTIIYWGNTNDAEKFK